MLLLVLSCSPYLADKAPLWATIIIVALLNINFAIAIFVQVARVHKLFTMHCRGKGLPALWNGAGLLGLQMRQQCLLVAVPDGRGAKLASLAVENMLGQREHVRRNGELGQVAEVIVGLAHLIGVAQRGAETPLVVSLKRDHPLALREH